MWWLFFMAGLCLTVGLFLKAKAEGDEVVAYLRGDETKIHKGKPWLEYIRPVLPGPSSMSWASDMIVQSGISLTPELVWAGSYGGGIAVAALVFTVNALSSSDPARLLLMTLVGGLLGAAAVPGYVWEKAKESREKRRRELLPLVQQLKVASATGVGTSYDALFAIAEEDDDSLLAYDLRQARSAASRGEALRDSLMETAKRTGVKEFIEIIETILDAEDKHVPLYQVLAGIEERLLNDIEVAAANAETKADDKLAVPLAAMLFPAYIILIIGPGMLTVSKAFRF